MMDWTHINAHAMAESLQPVHPYIPKQSPFWNGYAKRKDKKDTHENAARTRT